MTTPGDHDRIKAFMVPDLGEGLEEVTLSCWRVAVGDDVELNETLCSVETAKAEVEIPSPYAGRIVEIHGAEGDVLAAGALRLRTATAPGPPDEAPQPVVTPVAPRTCNGASAARRPV